MDANWQVKRILIRKDEASNYWVAQCVDFDVCAQSKTREGLFKAFGHVYYGEILVALENRTTPRFCDAPMSAKIEWANKTERSTDATEKVSWSEFVPAWVDEAFGKLAKAFGTAPWGEPVEIKEPAGAAV